MASGNRKSSRISASGVVKENLERSIKERVKTIFNTESPTGRDRLLLYHVLNPLTKHSFHIQLDHI